MNDYLPTLTPHEFVSSNSIVYLRVIFFKLENTRRRLYSDAVPMKMPLAGTRAPTRLDEAKVNEGIPLTKKC
jgi:hypothetical protein